jgi:hypothetical protein
MLHMSVSVFRGRWGTALSRVSTLSQQHRHTTKLGYAPSALNSLDVRCANEVMRAGITRGYLCALSRWCVDLQSATSRFSQSFDDILSLPALAVALYN